jgi:hypothetical protein
MQKMAVVLNKYEEFLPCSKKKDCCFTFLKASKILRP